MSRWRRTGLWRDGSDAYTSRSRYVFFSFFSHRQYTNIYLQTIQWHSHDNGPCHLTYESVWPPMTTMHHHSPSISTRRGSRATSPQLTAQSRRNGDVHQCTQWSCLRPPHLSAPDNDNDSEWWHLFFLISIFSFHYNNFYSIFAVVYGVPISFLNKMKSIFIITHYYGYENEIYW
jgi:hypothetical protein